MEIPPSRDILGLSSNHDVPVYIVVEGTAEDADYIYQ
jgi:hypothetical protein